jgi:hypothetical protein
MATSRNTHGSFLNRSARDLQTPSTIGCPGRPFRDSLICSKTLSAVIFSSRVIPDTHHAVFMPEKHGLEVTSHAGFCVGFGGRKAILAIRVVKLVSCSGLMWEHSTKTCHGTFFHRHFLP